MLLEQCAGVLPERPLAGLRAGPAPPRGRAVEPTDVHRGKIGGDRMSGGAPAELMLCETPEQYAQATDAPPAGEAADGPVPVIGTSVGELRGLPSDTKVIRF